MKNFFWNSLPQNRGQICAKYYVQLAGAPEGDSPKGFKRLRAYSDSSDGSWSVSLGRAEINSAAGTRLPSPREALEMLLRHRA